MRRIGSTLAYREEAKSSFYASNIRLETTLSGPAEVHVGA